MRMEAQDRALTRLDALQQATTGGPADRLRAFVDSALANDSPLVRSFWLAAAGALVAAEPAEHRKALYDAATRRIHATFRVDFRERHAAVRVLAERILPVV